jgi:pullulanase
LTDVHLLPVFDIASVPEAGCTTPTVPAAAPDSPAQQAAVMAQAATDCFNWGYDPLHFNAPEGSYASRADDGASRIREFRQMVMALHAAGLRVGMDVVYNHMSAAGQHPQSVLDRIVPGYYHRLDAQGRISRSTCCDNTATEHRMMRKLMLDSVRLWARAYRIDSFRFDLMGHQPREAMVALQQLLRADNGRDIQLIGEGWNFGEVANGARFVQAAQGMLSGTGIATFSDRARDALRGGGVGDGAAAMVARQGWLNGLAEGADRAAAGGAADLVRLGLAGTLRTYQFTTDTGALQRGDQILYAGQPAAYADAPDEVVNYVENHDNHTLWDVNAYKLPLDTPAAERARVQLLALATTAFSQGVAYFHAGVDLLRSKSLDGNSYDSGDWFNRLDWSAQTNHFGSGLPPAGDNQALWPLAAPRLTAMQLRPAPADIAFTRDGFLDLLRIRASSSLFRLDTAAAVQQRLSLHGTGPGQNPALIAGELDGRGLPGAGFQRVLYLLNTSATAQAITIASTRGQPWVLHPVHLATHAADRRAATQSAFDRSLGRFQVPGRTAVVFVLAR